MPTFEKSTIRNTESGDTDGKKLEHFERKKRCFINKQGGIRRRQSSDSRLINAGPLRPYREYGGAQG